ncbi:hypothetical protein E2320_021072 [Naja naja]|nr:hypothetical protein E2320_021072 [Naja naja]
MAGLRTAALHCEFKELDEVLLDGLVCGLRDPQIQRRLLAKPDLTLQSALDVACAVELSNRSTIEIKGASSSVAEKKTLAVHQEEATEEDANLPGDDDIHRLRTASVLDIDHSWRQNTECCGSMAQSNIVSYGFMHRSYYSFDLQDLMCYFESFM